MMVAVTLEVNQTKFCRFIVKPFNRLPKKISRTTFYNFYFTSYFPCLLSLKWSKSCPKSTLKAYLTPRYHYPFALSWTIFSTLFRILKANIAYDDGMWECQVTQSSYQTNDGLSSAPAQLVVRHPPAQPRIYADGRTFVSEREVSLLADREQVLTCESRGGNPAPVLSWHVGDVQVRCEQDVSNKHASFCDNLKSVSWVQFCLCWSFQVTDIL